MKKEMMKEALKMGIEMGAAGCVMVVTAEEMEILAGMQEEAEEKTTAPTQEQARAIAAGVLVYQLNGLVDELETMGYDICSVDNTGYYPDGIDHDFYWNEAKLDVENKRVLI